MPCLHVHRTQRSDSGLCGCISYYRMNNGRYSTTSGGEISREQFMVLIVETSQFRVRGHGGRNIPAHLRNDSYM